MANGEILLKITNDKIWFNAIDFIKINRTNIPHLHLTFNSHREIFWKVVMKGYDKLSQKLSVHIINYFADNVSDFLNQKPKNAIKYLEFGSFDWEFLEPILSSYRKSMFDHLLTNGIREISRQAQEKLPLANLEPIISKLEERFSIDINDCCFMLGYVKFEKYINSLNEKIEIKIPNDNILPEFDNIKYWFSKRLQTKKINVSVIFTMVDYKFKEYSATSKEIDSINHQLIEGIKLQRTLAITKTFRPQEVDKALFTSDELFGLDDQNDLEGNVFKQTEMDILELLLEKGDVRNKRELSYLSGRKQSISYRIRFTNHPNFGFIFLAEGELNNHFIWELLNSHATYIWTIEKGKKELELQYKRIEETINTILSCGRDNYKRAYKSSHLDNDLIFIEKPI